MRRSAPAPGAAGDRRPGDAAASAEHTGSRRRHKPAGTRHDAGHTRATHPPASHTLPHQNPQRIGLDDLPGLRITAHQVISRREAGVREAVVIPGRRSTGRCPFRRITAARDEFLAGGLTPRGFVAPAWLLSRHGERAARDADLEYTTRLRTVRDLRSGEDFPARSLVYSVRSNWRRDLSLAWNAALLQFVKHAPLLRLSIHPPDYSYPSIWHQIVDLIDAVNGMRTPTTYRDWIADQRSIADRTR